MKTLLLTLAIAAGLCSAQTGPAPAAPARVYVILSNGMVQFLQLDPSTLTIVGTTLTAVVPKAAAPPARVVEITQVATSISTYTLGQMPNATAPDLDVFWNGICLSVGVDYSVVSSMITFSGAGPGPGDVLRVVYRATS